eukprot:jgi/Antlo1/71/1264
MGRRRSKERDEDGFQGTDAKTKFERIVERCGRQQFCTGGRIRLGDDV